MPDRPAGGRDAWRAQPGLALSASRDERLDQSAVAVVSAAADARADGPRRSIGSSGQWSHSGGPDPEFGAPDDRRWSPVHRDAAGGNRRPDRGISGRREQPDRTIIPALTNDQFGQRPGFDVR